MADMNIQMKQRNGSVWDNLFPKTKAENVTESATQRFVSDIEKTAWNGKASTASPTFTGTPLVPTAAPGTNTTQIASTAFIQAAIAALIDGAPGAIDTLNELAAAMGDDPNFAATITNTLALKAPLANPTFTGIPAVPTAAEGTSTTQAASTAFVAAAVAAVIANIGAKITVNATEPATPSGGDFWYAVV